MNLQPVKMICRWYCVHHDPGVRRPAVGRGCLLALCRSHPSGA